MSQYSEKEIMEQSIKILEEYGELSTTELKNILNQVMQPSGEDLIINMNRNDTKFDQKVRNMISHRKSNDLYKYFEYSKRGTVGILTSKTLFSGKKIEEIHEDNIEYVESKTEIHRKEKKKQFNARKVDFEEKSKKNQELGELGEIFVLQYEKQRLPRELSDKVRHISKEDGDGAGYDILSYTTEGEIRFLEVKTTTGELETPFYLTENERLFLEMYGEEAEIVRVYQFDKETNTGQIHKINGKEFFDSIKLQAIAYKASFRKEKDYE